MLRTDNFCSFPEVTDSLSWPTQQDWEMRAVAPFVQAHGHTGAHDGFLPICMPTLAHPRAARGCCGPSSCSGLQEGHGLRAHPQTGTGQIAEGSASHR